jgi:hypothetical protein
MKRIVLLIGFAVTWLSGCVTYDRGTLAAASTTTLSIPMTVVEEAVRGKACRDLWQNGFQLAVDDALKQAPGANALTHVTYSFERFCIVVQGTAVRIP